MDAASAYDPKELMSELKSRGLDLAEDAARHVVESTFAWLEKSAAASPNKVDDALVLGVSPVLKKYALEKIDKIDGKVG